MIAFLLAMVLLPDTTLFHETFDHADLDLEATWQLEGTGRAWVEDGRLHLQEDSNGVGLVLWLRQIFPENLQLSYTVEFSNNRCIGVFFIAAAGPFETERTGAYEEYIHGDIDSYGFSFHRYFPDGRNNPGANVRRNSGFHLLSHSMSDPMLEAGRPYSVDITKEGPDLIVRVDGELVHHVTDEGEFGPPHGAGRIGFRLRGHESCVMSLDEIRVTTSS